MKARRSIFMVFRWPLAFAVLSLAGLVLGLTGEGLPDAASWLLLGSVPVFIAIAAARAARPVRPQPIIIQESPQCTCATLVCPCSPSSPRSPVPAGHKLVMDPIRQAAETTKT